MTEPAKLTLGFRDAIHVPYVVVQCDRDLHPGSKCSLRSDRTCVMWVDAADEPDWHGIADPFLLAYIPAGTPFRLLIRPECFSRLRNDFQIEVHDRGGTLTCHEVCDIW